MASPRTAGTRRYDPDRSDRIIAAALRVVDESGVDGLTFRAVARMADVPLGSITYHFSGKAGLLHAVVRAARERSRDHSTSFLAEAVAEHGLASGVARLVEELTVRQHRQLVMEHELYLLALRDAALRDESRQWSTDFVDLLAHHTDPLTASTLGYLFDGACMQAAVFDTMVFAADIEPEIRRILAADSTR
ncbi:TetR/AcrR family transcriptional regulator [Leucobacter soli]|uniref:HTH-type transcriptional regulator RcdA n=1 Tax=Leucobacter soli TaxID=2812850 RepID=A0A916NMB1_9MICO|nr:TetR family transcriptional regulator [Leucobacter soli]CAG7604187.1 HTH-type transcriptional regulator RcdA [Leucobacter soli]